MCLAAMREACCQMIAAARRCGARVIVAGSDATDAPEPYLHAGAEVTLIGEGLATLEALMRRLDEDVGLNLARLTERLSGWPFWKVMAVYDASHPRTVRSRRRTRNCRPGT